MLPSDQAGGTDDQRDAEGRGGAPGMRQNDDDARHRQRQRRILHRQQAFPGAAHRQPDGEHHLDLHHKAGEPRCDQPIDGNEQQPELADTDKDAIGGEIAPRHRRPLEEKCQGQRRQREAQRREQQRRQGIEAQPDDDEVGAPDGDDRQREEKGPQPEGGIAGVLPKTCAHLARASP
jgi:hypothetical protein